MKRVYLHLLFWIFFITQFAIIEYLWGRATMPNFPQAALVWVAIKAAFLYTIAKVFFAYYLIYYAFDKMTRDKSKLLPNIFEILVAFFITIIIDRLITNYLIIPYAYKNDIATAPLLEPRRVTVVVLYTGYATGLMIAIKSVRTQLATIEREKNLVKEKLEAELKFLRNQVNPHFLFNTLNNIYALTRKKSDNAPEAVMKLSELLSFMLYESGKDFIAISDEIKILEDYIDLERMRYNQRLSIRFTKNIDDPYQPIAPLLFLPIVENAFKHGVSETRFDSFVHLTIELERGILKFSVENSIECAKEKNTKSHIGLNNIKRQLELMYGEYIVDIKPGEKTFAVSITLNLNSYGKV